MTRKDTDTRPNDRQDIYTRITNRVRASSDRSVGVAFNLLRLFFRFFGMWDPSKRILFCYCSIFASWFIIRPSRFGMNIGVIPSL